MLSVSPSHNGYGTATSCLEMGWTLFHSGVVPEKCQAGVDLLSAPRLSVSMLGFSPVEVASLYLRGGRWVLMVVGYYAPNSSSEYGPSLESFEWLLMRILSVNSFLLSRAMTVRPEIRVIQRNPIWTWVALVLGVLCSAWILHNKHHPGVLALGTKTPWAAFQWFTLWLFHRTCSYMSLTIGWWPGQSW